MGGKSRRKRMGGPHVGRPPFSGKDPLERHGWASGFQFGPSAGTRMSMQGYASKWDSCADALRQWAYAEPRTGDASVIKDHMLGNRLIQSLEVLARSDGRDTVQARNETDDEPHADRYAVLGDCVRAMIDSGVRTSRMAVREMLDSTRLDTANRLASLDASQAEELPEHMKNAPGSEAVAQRMMMELLTEEGKKASQKPSESGGSDLNCFTGRIEKKQIGEDFSAGLRQAPQDLSLGKKGMVAEARTGEANPGASYNDYRARQEPDPVAEEAEAPGPRRDGELNGFGSMQNPIFGWANPMAFAWHMPVPTFPQSSPPKETRSRDPSKIKKG